MMAPQTKSVCCAGNLNRGGPKGDNANNLKTKLTNSTESYKKSNGPITYGQKANNDELKSKTNVKRMVSSQAMQRNNQNKVNSVKTVDRIAAGANAMGSGKLLPNKTKKAQPNYAHTATSLARSRLTRKEPVKPKEEPVIEEPPIKPDVGIQTNETEILDYDAIIGDIKIMRPSRVLVMELEKTREELEKKSLMKKTRQFEEHSVAQEKHLNDLSEFLDKACISKRMTKPREAMEMDRSLLKSMDEMLSRHIPKAESITDIKERIRNKEKELLSIFESVDKMENFCKK